MSSSEDSLGPHCAGEETLAATRREPRSAYAQARNALLVLLSIVSRFFHPVGLLPALFDGWAAASLSLRCASKLRHSVSKLLHYASKWSCSSLLHENRSVAHRNCGTLYRHCCTMHRNGHAPPFCITIAAVCIEIAPLCIEIAAFCIDMIMLLPSASKSQRSASKLRHCVSILLHYALKWSCSSLLHHIRSVVLRNCGTLH